MSTDNAPTLGPFARGILEELEKWEQERGEAPRALKGGTTVDMYDALNAGSQIMSTFLGMLKEDAEKEGRAAIADWLEQKRVLIPPQVSKSAPEQ